MCIKKQQHRNNFNLHVYSCLLHNIKESHLGIKASRKKMDKEIFWLQEKVRKNRVSEKLGENF